jgi:DNA-directed RNA polymerase subunit F
MDSKYTTMTVSKEALKELRKLAIDLEMRPGKCIDFLVKFYKLKQKEKSIVDDLNLMK